MGSEFNNQEGREGWVDQWCHSGRPWTSAAPGEVESTLGIKGVRSILVDGANGGCVNLRRECERAKREGKEESLEREGQAKRGGRESGRRQLGRQRVGERPRPKRPWFSPEFHSPDAQLTPK